MSGWDALGEPEFTAGLQWGLLALGVGVVLVIGWRLRGWKVSLPVWGVLAAGAGVLGLRSSVGAPDELPLALAALVVAGVIAARFSLPILAESALAVPGAAILAVRCGVVDVTWVRVVVFAAVVVAGPLVSDFDRRHRRRCFGSVFFALSSIGVYYTVPDTEQALVLLAVTLVLVPLAWPVAFASLSRPGSLAAVGLLAWVSATGGIGRLSSVIGGIASLGLLVAEPLADLTGRDRPRPLAPLDQSWWGVPVAATLHLVAVVVGSRVVGLQSSVTTAASLAIAELVAAVGLLLIWSRVRARLADRAPRDLAQW